jgi:hypothetical protein
MAWVLRPTIVREYKGTQFPPANGLAYRTAVMNAIDQIWSNSTLANFWQNGTLIPNTAETHPYQSAVPARYASAQRWYQLTCSANPPRASWVLNTPINVFAVALSVGVKPSRQWLVFCYATLADQSSAVITLPDFGNLTLTVPRVGTYLTVDETTKVVSQLSLPSS